MNGRLRQASRLLLVAAAILFVCFCGIERAFAANTIMGTVYDKLRNPLPDIEVELLDNYYRLIARQRTGSNGRYEFGGLRDGRFYVRVYAFRYDLMDETREVELASITSIPNQEPQGMQIEDFYLQPKEGGLKAAELAVVFAQEVPKEAERNFKKAIEALQNRKNDEAFLALQEALRIYPDYYQALHRYGLELMLRGLYIEAAQVFIKAAQINPKSAYSFYLAAQAFYKMGEKYYKASLIALAKAVELAPNSAGVHLLMGTIYRAQGRFPEAEKSLLKAKKLTEEKNPDIHKELAQLYANDLKRYKEAADELEQYIKATKMSEDEVAKTKKIVAELRQKAAQQPAVRQSN